MSGIVLSFEFDPCAPTSEHIRQIREADPGISIEEIGVLIQFLRFAHEKLQKMREAYRIAGIEGVFIEEAREIYVEHCQCRN